MSKNRKTLEKRSFNRSDLVMRATVRAVSDPETMFALVVADVSLAGVKMVGQFPADLEGPIQIRFERTTLWVDASIVEQAGDMMRCAFDIPDDILAELAHQQPNIGALLLEATSPGDPSVGSLKKGKGVSGAAGHSVDGRKLH